MVLLKRVLFAFAMIAALFCSGSRAQQPSTDEKSEETRSGSISGRVINDGGQPIGDAMVYVRPFAAVGPGRTTIADGDGNFQLNGLEPLAYTVTASAPGYVSRPRDPDSPQPTYFRVGESVNLALIKGGVITGGVTASSGDPIVGIRVRAYMIRDGNNQPLRYGAFFNERTTDDRGIYRIYGLNPGTYVVEAGGNSSSGFYQVSPYDNDTPTFAPSSTRDTAMEIAVHAGEEATNIDIRYRGSAGHIVSGNAVGPVLPNPTGVQIYLSSIFKGESESRSSAYQVPGMKGFAFSGVADGEYDLIAQSFVPGGDWQISEPRRIKVNGADVTGIELATKSLGAISGHIILEESKLPACQGKRRPVFGETLVTPWHNEKNATRDQPQYIWSIGGPVLPDRKGDFVLRNLVPGQYRFHSRTFAKYWYLASISLQPPAPPAGRAAQANRPIDAARNWTLVKPGDLGSQLLITFAEGAASFHGRVKAGEGQKLPPRVFVYLVPAEKEKAEDVLRFFSYQVAADGTFALNNLPPGRYWAIAKPAADSETNIFSKLRLPDESASRAKLRQEGESLKIETELKPCQNVTDYQLSLAP